MAHAQVQWLGKILGWRRPTTWLIGLLAINGVFAAAYLWSLGETTAVHVTVEPNRIVGRVEDLELAVATAAPSVSQIGLFVNPPEGSQYVGWTNARSPAPVATLPPIGALWGQTDWGSVEVVGRSTNPSGSPVRSADWSPDSDPGSEATSYLDQSAQLTPPGTRIALLPETHSPPYEIRAQLLRGGNGGAGIIIGGTDGTGYAFWFRPGHRDAAWWMITPTGWVGPLANGVFERSAEPSVQQLVRLLLRGYPAAVVLLIAALAIGHGWRTRRVVDDARLHVAKAPPATESDPPPVLAIPANGPKRASPALDPVAIGLSVTALVAASLVAIVLLEGIPHVQDSVAYLFQAKVFAAGRAWAPVPELADFFWHEFVVMYEGRWFGKYPPGWPALLAIGVLVGHPEIVNPIFAAITLYVVYLLGRELYGRGVGLLAAGLGLTSPFFLFMSGSMMAHPSGLLFVSLFLLGFVRTQRTGNPWVALGTGAALGMAAIIRPWTAVVCALPVVLFELPDLIREPTRTRRWVLACIATFPFLLAWFGFQAAVTGNPLQNTMLLWWSFDRVGFGPDHGPFGFWPLNGVWNTSQNLDELLRHLFGWPPAFTLAFALVPFAARRARRADLLLAASFLCLVAGYALWWAHGIMYGPRFYYEGVTALLLLTARGVQEIASLARSRALATGMVGILVLANLSLYMPAQVVIHYGYNYVNRQAVNAVEAANVGRAVVFVPVGEWYEWWNYGSAFSSNSPFLDGEVIYARDLGDLRNQELIARLPDRAAYRLVGHQVVPYAPEQED